MKLSNGTEIPIIGLGTWQLDPMQVNDLIKTAIATGYRHFDCAPVYNDEKEIGNALQQAFQSGQVARKEVFQHTLTISSLSLPKSGRPNTNTTMS